jgi:hypothetical protein
MLSTLHVFVIFAIEEHIASFGLVVFAKNVNNSIRNSVRALKVIHERRSAGVLVLRCIVRGAIRLRKGLRSSQCWLVVVLRRPHLCHANERSERADLSADLDLLVVVPHGVICVFAMLPWVRGKTCLTKRSQDAAHVGDDDTDMLSGAKKHFSSF